MLSQRILAQACVRTPDPRGMYAGQRGAIECDEPFYVALVADTLLGGGACVRTEDCIALFDLAASATLEPGEVIDRCRFSDFTFAQRSPTTPVGYCDRTLGICSAECRCGAGQVCAFASHEVPAGVCVPPTDGFRQSRPCRAMPDREPCPTGEACLFPVRGDLNIPDRERWGVCVERARCAAIDQYFASRGFDRPFVCDTTLTE
ncbi:MAG: hypothetical protein U0269_11265 [Polyangiales bacterium]